MRASYVLMIGVAAGAIGCADPLVGNWENVNNEDDVLAFYADGSGEHTVQGSERTSDGSQISIDFTYEVEWEADRSDRYDVEHECSRASIRVDGRTLVNSCRDAAEYFSTRYTSECELQRRGEEIDCTTDFGDVYTYELAR